MLTLLDLYWKAATLDIEPELPKHSSFSTLVLKVATFEPELPSVLPFPGHRLLILINRN